MTREEIITSALKRFRERQSIFYNGDDGFSGCSLDCETKWENVEAFLRRELERAYKAGQLSVDEDAPPIW